MIAGLPMYDWPGVGRATDLFWAALRDALRRQGIAAPDTLTRPFAEALWLSPDLVLAQTCGMPYRLRLHGRVALIGALDYGVEGCPPGYYRSVIVRRPGDQGLRAAVNAPHSQSGYAALKQWMGGLTDWVETGSHAASITTVAEGRADLAAIDAVTWRHALRDMAEARELEVAGMTAPTPGLPLIAASDADVPRLRQAVGEAVAGLAAPVREALFVTGFVTMESSAYLNQPA